MTRTPSGRLRSDAAQLWWLASMGEGRTKSTSSCAPHRRPARARASPTGRRGLRAVGGRCRARGAWTALLAPPTPSWRGRRRHPLGCSLARLAIRMTDDQRSQPSSSPGGRMVTVTKGPTAVKESAARFVATGYRVFDWFVRTLSTLRVTNRATSSSRVPVGGRLSSAAGSAAPPVTGSTSVNWPGSTTTRWCTSASAQVLQQGIHDAPDAQRLVEAAALDPHARPTAESVSQELNHLRLHRTHPELEADDQAPVGQAEDSDPRSLDVGRQPGAAALCVEFERGWHERRDEARRSAPTLLRRQPPGGPRAQEHRDRTGSGQA